MTNLNIPFLLNDYNNKITWISDIVFHLNKQPPNIVLPLCKICFTPPFYINTCVAHMYYIVHK